MTQDDLTDQNGLIRRQGVHDARIQGFNYSCGDRLDVYLRDEVGVIRQLHLRGLKQIGFNDVVDGTIISDIFRWLIGDDRNSIGPCRDAFVTLFGNNYREADFDDLCAQTLQRHAKRYFIFIESSYGGTIAAICDDVSFIDAEGRS